MKRFTDLRDASWSDELWFLEHLRVFTQGQAGKAEHVLAPGDIPVVQVDRGGQVTYHGPGQLVAYVMFDLKRLGISVRDLVHGIEAVIVDVLAQWGVAAAADANAPGVYIKGNKIAAVGMRVRRGCSFHGLSLNLDMDLEPFNRINPCGYAGMQVTRLSDHADYRHEQHFNQLKAQMADAICRHFAMTIDAQQQGLPLFEQELIE